MREVAITTKDNPYNPLVNFDEWLAFDTLKGYNTCAYLARMYKGDDNSMSEDESDKATEEAVDEIIRIDFMDLYRKVVM